MGRNYTIHSSSLDSTVYQFTPGSYILFHCFRCSPPLPLPPPFIQRRAGMVSHFMCAVAVPPNTPGERPSLFHSFCKVPCYLISYGYQLEQISNLHKVYMYLALHSVLIVLN